MAHLLIVANPNPPLKKSPVGGFLIDGINTLQNAIHINGVRFTSRQG